MALCARLNFTCEQQKAMTWFDFSLETVYSGDSAEDETVVATLDAGKSTSSLGEKQGGLIGIQCFGDNNN